MLIFDGTVVEGCKRKQDREKAAEVKTTTKDSKGDSHFECRLAYSMPVRDHQLSSSGASRDRKAPSTQSLGHPSCGKLWRRSCCVQNTARDEISPCSDWCGDAEGYREVAMIASLQTTGAKRDFPEPNITLLASKGCSFADKCDPRLFPPQKLGDEGGISRIQGDPKRA